MIKSLLFCYSRSGAIFGLRFEVETDYDFSEAYISEKYALAYGITFISDFIYDDYHSAFGVDNIIALKLNDKWGILDKEGNTVIPFCFEEIFLFENIFFTGEETAFAKYNGKYGILDINETVCRLQKTHS